MSTRLLLLVFILTFAYFGGMAQKSKLIDHLNATYGVDVSRGFRVETRDAYLKNSIRSNPSGITYWVNKDGGCVFSLDRDLVSDVKSSRPSRLSLKVPISDGERTVRLELIKVEIFSTEFDVIDSEGKLVRFNTEEEVHYQGIIKGNLESVAAISFLRDGSISGLVSGSGLDLSIGKMKNSNEHIVYDQKFVKPSLNMKCDFNDVKVENGTAIDWSEVVKSSSSGSCKTLGIYFELDHALFVEKGSDIQNTAAFMSGIFNQVKMLYANEDIEIEISRIKVWDKPDPYVNFSDTERLVNKFQEDLNGNYPGHVANFISGRVEELGGGIAYDIPSQLCTKANQVVVSAITSTYQNVPTYSWTVSVITHEMGHILGSRHTHWCGWSGGPIDGCAGYVEEDDLGNGCAVGPIPSNGGTIMSYCHWVSAGINFNLGFGLQPGNIIRAKIAAATCILSSGETAVPEGLELVLVDGNEATVQWTVIANANYYQVEYKEADSDLWIYAGQSSSNTFSFSNLKLDTDYQWRIKTSCSDYSLVESFRSASYVLKFSKPVVFGNVCKNSHVTVHYTAQNLDAGNQTIIELSSVNGTFENPTQVGVPFSGTQGVVSFAIPPNITSGTGYRIRLKASQPVAVSQSSAPFEIKNTSAVNFVNFSAGNPSESSFRTWVSATQLATAYYVVLLNNSTTEIPSAVQIKNGLSGNGSSALKSGQISLLKANEDYHQIVGGLPAGMPLNVFYTLGNSSVCNMPVAVSSVSTLGSSNVPASCIPVLDCSDSDLINSFEVPNLGINVQASGCSPNGYGNNMDNVYFARKNSNYNFRLETGDLGQYVNIWIDKNMNGVFEADERVYSSGNRSLSHLGVLNTPTVSGLMKMRVQSSYSFGGNNACYSSSWGEVEDYLLYVLDQEPCPASVSLVSPQHDVNNGQGKIFKGEVLNVSNKLIENSAADYIGVKSITFEPGFTASNGTIFRAQLEANCGN